MQNPPVRLTAMASCAGCAAKLPQQALADVLRGLPGMQDPRLLIGAATSDDAAVFIIDESRALVQTLDFFTPIVDDPLTYGRIAATNSLSDVYAMGGRPLTAMNITGMPEELDLSIVNTILRGGAEKVLEAKCVLAGGHSIRIPEPVYGLSVTGIIHPSHIISNAGSKAGDVLILTKPLGTGIATTAIKRDRCPDALRDAAIASMSTLNTPGPELAEAGLVRAGTDVTGFGLLGHLGSMCRQSAVTAEINASALPLLDPAVPDLAADNCFPGGSKSNAAFAAPWTDFTDTPPPLQLVAADAQTSGGLLLSVPPEHVDTVLATCARLETLCAAIVGRMIPAVPGSHIIVRRSLGPA